MKEVYIPIFGLTLVLGIPDGTDGWLWRTELDETKTRYCQTDLFCLRMVNSRLGWNGIELILLPFIALLKWDAEVRK